MFLSSFFLGEEQVRKAVGGHVHRAWLLDSNANPSGQKYTLFLKTILPCMTIVMVASCAAYPPATSCPNYKHHPRGGTDTEGGESWSLIIPYL